MKQAHKTIAFWQDALKTRPTLRPFVKPELDRLQGITHKNLIQNGGFEQGEVGGNEIGRPPRLPGWWFYDRVGMVHGSKARYAWEKVDGATGTKALGFGPSKYPGIRGFVEVDPGWYRFRFRYKTQNRKLQVGVNILSMSDHVRPEKLTTPETVRKLANEDYHKFILRSWPTTDGQWKQVPLIIEIKKKQTLALMIEPFFMNEGEWAWFDDVELVKLY